MFYLAVALTGRRMTILTSAMFALFLLWLPLASAAECSDVRLSGPLIWPPYVNGEEIGAERTGLTVDLVSKIFSEMNIPFDIDDAKPWARVKSDLELVL